MNDPQPPSATFDLVVPVFNEAEALPSFFDRLHRLHLPCQPIFVDNGSSDASVSLLKKFPGATVICHERNEGYGRSVLDGIRAGTNEFVVIIDADCEYPPECIPRLLEELQHSDAVYASRLLNQPDARAAGMGWLKMKGNQCITALFNRLFRQNLTDLYTGCKALRRNCVEALPLEQSGFEHVLELSARLASRGCKISEIPVSFSSRVTGTSKMQHVPEVVKYFLLLYRYASLHKAGKL